MDFQSCKENHCETTVGTDVRLMATANDMTTKVVVSVLMGLDGVVLLVRLLRLEHEMSIMVPCQSRDLLMRFWLQPPGKPRKRDHYLVT